MPTINKRLDDLENRSSTDDKTVDIRVVWDDAELDRDNPDVIIVEWPEDENNQ